MVISSVFKGNIAAGQLLTKHQLRSKKRTDSHLRKYVVDKAKVKIADFLRYETNHVRQLKHIEDDVQTQLYRTLLPCLKEGNLILVGHIANVQC